MRIEIKESHKGRFYWVLRDEANKIKGLQVFPFCEYERECLTDACKTFEGSGYPVYSTRGVKVDVA